MTFDEYLLSKKIDAARFRSAEHERYHSLQQEYEQAGPISFSQQKLFLINPLRRKYKWAEQKTETTVPKPRPKPIIKPSR